MFPFLAIIGNIIIVIITTILFFSTLPFTGGQFSNWIRASWSKPAYWLIWVSRNEIIIFIFILFYFFCKLFFGDNRWRVDTIFHIYHMTSFNYDVKGARDAGLSCISNMRNSQIVSSVQNMLEIITWLWLCVSVFFVLFVYLFVLFSLAFFLILFFC